MSATLPATDTVTVTIDDIAVQVPKGTLLVEAAKTIQRDIPAGFLEKVDELIAMYVPRMRELRALLQKNPILQDRMIDVGILNAYR